MFNGGTHYRYNKSVCHDTHHKLGDSTTQFRDQAENRNKYPNSTQIESRYPPFVPLPEPFIESEVPSLKLPEDYRKERAETAKKHQQRPLFAVRHSPHTHCIYCKESDNKGEFQKRK
mmetsp:Transcript_12156/g.14686  ORF Transcript_12156/g.14686 Transcript_12156/m.14686 type:complete len:117 (-) Transcript_12156:524-874(-)